MRTIAKIVVIPAYCLFVAEMWLRILDPVPMLPRYVCAMPYGIRGNEPNKSYWHRTAEYRINIRTNSRGIRCDGNIDYKKPEGIRRIVLLGDSFGMGYGVDLEDMFTSRMVHYLEGESTEPIQIVNLSTSGHGNAEELIVLKAEGEKYEPDLVILAWHYTDYQDNVRSNLFKVKGNSVEQISKVYLPGVKTRERLFRIPAYRWLAEESQLYNFTRDLVSRKVKAFLSHLRSKEVATENSADQGEDPNEDYATCLTVALLEEIGTQCNDMKSRFMILDIPYRKDREQFESHFPKVDSSEVCVVSPIERFMDKKNGEKLYWEKSHGHFTPLGCDVVGRLLAETIRGKDMLNARQGYDGFD